MAPPRRSPQLALALTPQQPDALPVEEEPELVDALVELLLAAAAEEGEDDDDQDHA
jgi:hypothetical protein